MRWSGMRLDNMGMGWVVVSLWCGLFHTLYKERVGGGWGVLMSVINVGIFYRSPIGKPVLFIPSDFTNEIYKEEKRICRRRNFRKILVWRSWIILLRVFWELIGHQKTKPGPSSISPEAMEPYYRGKTRWLFERQSCWCNWYLYCPHINLKWIHLLTFWGLLFL